MSFEDAPNTGDSGADVGPDFGDTGSDAPEQDFESTPPERQYVDIDDPDNRYVRVKVDGADEEIPFSEALRGYSREADYTRKAQALAEQRKEAEFGLNLQRALQVNPEMTLQILAQQHGINYGAAPPPPAEAAAEDEYVDPLERAIVEERNARVALEERLAQRDADQQLRGVLDGLRDEYSLGDEDLREVVQTAASLGLGLDQIPLAWKMIAFDRINARVRAANTKQQQEREENERRTAAKTSAGQIVSAGGQGSNGLTDRRPSTGNMSLRDAIESAIEEVEGRR